MHNFDKSMGGSLGALKKFELSVYATGETPCLDIPIEEFSPANFREYKFTDIVGREFLISKAISLTSGNAFVRVNGIADTAFDAVTSKEMGNTLLKLGRDCEERNIENLVNPTIVGGKSD